MDFGVPIAVLSSSNIDGRFDIFLSVKNTFHHHSATGLPSSQPHGILPEFSGPVPNVTVPMGRDATLQCTVYHLATYKVAWVKVDTQTILTIHQHVITRNPRISLSHSDHKVWYLHIRNVQESDRGYYMCQINTVPMKHQLGFLDIVVPPNIIDAETSSDVVVREQLNVSLVCRASGYPSPFIIWRREDGSPIPLQTWEGNPLDTVDGEILNITRVSRLHMAAYLCIASNGVPPSVSKRIVLQVHFPPQTWIPNQLVGGYHGGEVVLECHTEAFPKSINYWTTDRGDMITSGDKYETTVKDETYKVYMSLKVKAIVPEDFGTYKCIARNFLGETDGSVQLYEIPAPPTTPTPSTEKNNLEAKDHKGEDNLLEEIEHDIMDDSDNAIGLLREKDEDDDKPSARPSRKRQKIVSSGNVFKVQQNSVLLVGVVLVVLTRTNMGYSLNNF